MIPVVGGIVRNDCGEILLAERPPGKHLAGLWEFPGGKIERDESPAEALLRELQEELKLDVRVGECLGIFPFTYDRVAIELHVYLAEALSAPQATDEVQRFKWVKPRAVLESELAPADVEPLRVFIAQAQP